MELILLIFQQGGWQPDKLDLHFWSDDLWANVGEFINI